MTNEEAIKNIKEHCYFANLIPQAKEALDIAIKALEQEPCEMSVEEYRQRMIQAFHNADCDELIAICVLPTEKEFEHLEWLLKTHYKKEPCEDAISRQSAIFLADDLKEDLPDNGRIAEMVLAHNEGILEYQTKLSLLPSVTSHYTEVEIQKMQEMEQTEIQKAYELGKAEQPKTGHWIEGQTDNPNIHNILCSCCFEGYPSKGHANSQYTKEKYRWCPSCGCRMKGVE